MSAEGRNNIPDAALIDGSAWRFRMDEAGQPYDDVDFIDQLITQATDSGSPLLGTPIDPHQVYVIGESRGADPWVRRPFLASINNIQSVQIA